MPFLDPYIVDFQAEHTHTIILLHGRSSTARDFAKDLFALTSSSGQNLHSALPGLRWVFPDAGMRWCTSAKEDRSAWFDTYSLVDMRQREDLQVSGLREGVTHIKTIVESEVAILGGKADRVILGGFSQGAATALWSLLTGAALTTGALRAFVGLSPWMPFTEKAQKAAEGPATRERLHGLTAQFLEILGITEFVPIQAIEECLKQITVSLGHDPNDAVVSFTYCQRISDIFRHLNVDTQMHEYYGAERQGHWIKEPEQVDGILSLLEKITGEVKTKGPDSPRGI